LAVFKSKDVSVADRHAKDVGGQVLQSFLPSADGNDIHDPVLTPDLRRDLIEEPGLFEQVSELCPKDPGEGDFRQEEVVFSGLPGVTVGCQPTPGYQVVHVGVVEEISSPALQDSDHAERASDVFGIGSELLKGLLRCLEE